MSDLVAAISVATVVGVPARLSPVFGLVTLLTLRVDAARAVVRSVLFELPRIAGSVGAAALTLGAAGWRVTPTRLATLTVATGAVIGIGRALVNMLARARRRRGRGLKRTLIVGAGPTSAGLARALHEHPEEGFLPIGFVDDAGHAEVSLPLLGNVEELPALVERHRAHAILVGYGLSRDSELARRLQRTPARVEVLVVPRLFDLGVASDGDTDVWGYPMMQVRPSGPASWAWPAKRALDLTAAIVGLLMAAPFMLLSAGAVRLTSRGPILFRQQRVGRDGRLFELMKFRTMTVNEDSDTTWSVNGDARLTIAGRILRATHLDELPQLLNVLRGDMSLVGPRPERPFFVDRFQAMHRRYDERHRVPVGMTGWAQIHGLVGNTSIEDRARFDNRYIERWSPFHDIAIILRTPASIIRRILPTREPAEEHTTAFAVNGNGSVPAHANGTVSLNGNRAHRNGHDKVIDLRDETIAARGRDA